MAATITDAGNGTSITADAVLTTGATISVASGDWLVAIFAASNDGTLGASPFSVPGSQLESPATAADDRASITYDPGAAGAGATLLITTFPATDTRTNVKFDALLNNNTDQKAVQVYKVSPGAGETISFVSANTTGNTGNTNAYAAPTATSVTSGDIIFGAAAIETDDAITGDADTTMGSWSTVITRLADGGADASTMSCVSQYKTTTGTGDQTWTATSSNARDSARTYLIIRSAVSGVDAALAKTLGTLTSSAAYTVDTNTATLAKTLGAVTSSAAYTVDTNNAALTKTLGALTISAAYTVDSLFSLTATLDAATSSAVYTVDALYSLSKTLDALTGSAAFTTDSLFSVSATLGSVTSSAAYTVESQFALSKTLADLTLSSTFTSGAVSSDFALAQTLAALTSSAAYTVESQFDLSKTLGALTVSSAYTVDTNNAALSQTLGALTGSATYTIDSLLSLVQTLGNLTSASVFTVANGPEYDLDKTLDDLTAAATFAVTGGLVVPEEGPHGPGWKLFGHDDGYHPPSQRTRKAETVERDILAAYNRAHGIEDEVEQAEAVRELKHVAATALSVGKKADDERLTQLAQQIIALKRLDLDLQAYLARVGMILTEADLLERDDMEAFTIMAALS